MTLGPEVSSFPEPVDAAVDNPVDSPSDRGITLCAMWMTCE